MTVSGIMVYLEDIMLARRVLSDESIGKVVCALCDRVAGELSVIDLTQAEMVLFTIMGNKVDRDIAKLIAKSEAGKTGGRPKQTKADESAEKQTKADESTIKHPEANKPNSNCNCNSNSISNSNSNCIPSADAEGGEGGTTGAAAPSSGAAARFIPPTVEEVRRYCEDHGYRVDADQFVAHYESNGWKVGRNPMKSWRAAIQTWLRSGYNDKPKAAQKPKMVHAQDFKQREYTDSQLEGEMSPLLAEALAKVQRGDYDNVGS